MPPPRTGGSHPSSAWERTRAPPPRPRSPFPRSKARLSLFARENPLKKYWCGLGRQKVAAAKTKAHSTPLGGNLELVAEEVVVDQPGRTDLDSKHREAARGPEVVGVDELGVVGLGQRLGDQLRA